MTKGSNEKKAVLEMSNISKSFPGVKALDHVSFFMEEGEIHALMGENGAGKSTLIKIISGVHTADEGSMKVFGEEMVFQSPRHAFSKGISVVHQERNLVPTFTVAENILLERIAENTFQKVRWNKIFDDAVEFMEMVGLEISPYQYVENISAGQKQLIEIARALSLRARIILLDEPTASLSLKEAEHLIETIRKLKIQGVSFMYVSHKLEEVFEIADCVTVLRDGRNAGPSKLISEIDRAGLIEMMVGRNQDTKMFSDRDRTDREVVLEVRNFRSKKSPKANSFKLHNGEILGWYGLVGAGRTELVKGIIGADKEVKGEIFLKGKRIKIRTVEEALKKANIVYVSENRQEEGLFLQHPITRNIAASIWSRLRNRMGLLNIKEENRLAEEYKLKLDIRTPSIHQLSGNLSGGNKQKVCISKGLCTKPEIIIFDEPTVGIDIKTKAEIHELIRKLADEGISIIVISSDMPEIVQLVDRMIVFKDGEIKGELHNTKDYEVISHKIMDSIVAKSNKAKVG